MAETGHERRRMAENGRERPRLADTGRGWIFDVLLVGFQELPRMAENGRECFDPRTSEEQREVVQVFSFMLMALLLSSRRPNGPGYSPGGNASLGNPLPTLWHALMV